MTSSLPSPLRNQQEHAEANQQDHPRPDQGIEQMPDQDGGHGVVRNG